MVKRKSSVRRSRRQKQRGKVEFIPIYIGNQKESSEGSRRKILQDINKQLDQIQIQVSTETSVLSQIRNRLSSYFGFS